MGSAEALMALAAGNQAEEDAAEQEEVSHLCMRTGVSSLACAAVLCLSFLACQDTL